MFTVGADRGTCSLGCIPRRVVRGPRVGLSDPFASMSGNPQMPKPVIAAGDPCWIDLMTSDPDTSREFYTHLFGWTYETGDEEKYGGYVMAFAPGAPAAG